MLTLTLTLSLTLALTRLFLTKRVARPNEMPMAIPLESSPAPMRQKREASMSLGEIATRLA